MTDGGSSSRQGAPRAGKGGGTQPRARNKNGQWRKKRSDAGKPRPRRRG